MLKIYRVENTLLKNQFHKRIYFYCLLKNWSLIKYLIPHIVYGILYSLHMISRVKYYRQYWDYLYKMVLADDMIQELRTKVSRNVKIYDENGLFFSYAPKKIIEKLFVYDNIINLEDLADVKDAELQYLVNCQIVDFACVEMYDHKIMKKAKKTYFIIKNKLVEKTGKSTFLILLKQLGILALLSLCITIFVLMLTPLEGALVLPLILNPLVVILNWLPIIICMLILYGLFNSIFTSFTLSSILFIVLVLINRFKMSFRDDPFVFLDIKYAKEAAMMTNNYSLFIDKAMIVVFILFIFVFIWLCTRNIRKVNNFIIRVFLIAIPILIVNPIFDALYLNSDLYDAMWNDMFGNMWKTGNQYVARGFNYSFLKSYTSSKISAPDDYEEANVLEALSAYETINMNEAQKVNIIGIMLEAYNDFTTLNIDAEIDETPYQYMHEIQAQSYSGKLYTDIFAGGTIATERAFLTGYSSLSEFRKATNSYVRYFKDQGYYTEAMHPCYGWFYNRNNVNTYGLGFDSFSSYENAYETMVANGEVDETYAGFLMDTDFFDQIIKGYEDNLERDMPYFNFSVTYQNHGPYSIYRDWENEYLKWDESYNEDDYNLINNYLAYIEKTDKAIKKLYDYINEQEEPIVLILFGDHNPYLGEGNSGFDLMGIDLDLGNEHGAANYYETPYVITANAAAKQTLDSDFYGVGNTISPMFLMNEFFSAAGLNIGSSYSQYLANLKNTIDVINPIFIKEQKEYILRSAFDSDKLSEFYNVQYYEQYENN